MMVLYTKVINAGTLVRPMSRLTPFIIAIITASVAVFTVSGHHGLAQLMRLSHEAHLLERENLLLQMEIDKLQRNIEIAGASPVFLEQRAREELALANTGEVIYVFPKSHSKNGVTPKELVASPATRELE